MSKEIINVNLIVEYTGAIKGRPYVYAYDSDTYDGTSDSAMGSGTTREEAIDDLMASTECPYCKEISLNKRDDGMYECIKCHAEVNFG